MKNTIVNNIADIKKHVDLVYQVFKIDPKIVPKEQMIIGLGIELEHGKKFARIADTNVTKNSLYKTAQITIAHLIEAPDYYVRLKKMEEEFDKFWHGKDKNIFIRKK